MAEDFEPSKTQVIIIGAGPTGLSMAAQLLRYHIDFIIIEKNEKTTPFSKAVVIQARTLEIFNEIGLAEKAINEGRLTTAMNVFYKGKRKAGFNLAGLGNGLSHLNFSPYIDLPCQRLYNSPHQEWLPALSIQLLLET